MTACRPGPDIRAIIWSPAGRNRPTVNPDGVTGRRSRMDKEELLLRYECDGGEELYAEAKPRFEEALAENPGDARLLNAYGYLLECHGRRMIREAAGWYQQAIDADPGWAKPRFQQIGALSALHDAYEVIPAMRPGWPRPRTTPPPTTCWPWPTSTTTITPAPRGSSARA